MDLPSIKDPELIDAYETILGLDKKIKQAIADNKLMSIVMQHKTFAAYGFFKGFGSLLFSSIVQDAFEGCKVNTGYVNIMESNFYLSCLQIRDPEYVACVEDFLVQNKNVLSDRCYYNFIYTFVNMNL